MLVIEMGTVEEQVLGMGCKGSPVATLSLKGPLHIQAEMSSWRLELVEEPRRVVRGHVDYLRPQVLGMPLADRKRKRVKGRVLGSSSIKLLSRGVGTGKGNRKGRGKKWENMRSSKGKIQGERC